MLSDTDSISKGEKFGILLACKGGVWGGEVREKGGGKGKTGTDKTVWLV